MGSLGNGLGTAPALLVELQGSVGEREGESGKREHLVNIVGVLDVDHAVLTGEFLALEQGERGPVPPVGKAATKPPHKHRQVASNAGGFAHGPDDPLVAELASNLVGGEGKMDYQRPDLVEALLSTTNALERHRGKQLMDLAGLPRLVAGELEATPEPFGALWRLQEPDSGGGVLHGRADQREGGVDVQDLCVEHQRLQGVQVVDAVADPVPGGVRDLQARALAGITVKRATWFHVWRGLSHERHPGVDGGKHGATIQ